MIGFKQLFPVASDIALHSKLSSDNTNNVGFYQQRIYSHLFKSNSHITVILPLTLSRL